VMLFQAKLDVKDLVQNQMKMAMEILGKIKVFLRF
jgi:hypothetical protein